MSNNPFNFAIDIGQRGVDCSWDRGAGGYDAARKSRLHRERYNLGGSADDHLPHETLWDLRETSRDLRRNNGLYRGLIRVFARNVIGRRGFTLRAKDEVVAYWREWTARGCCDLRNKQPFWAMLKTAFAAQLVDGDHFLWWADEGRQGKGSLLPIEGDRVVTPVGDRDSVNGVYAGRYGEPRWYFVADEPAWNGGTPANPFGYVPESEGRWIKAESILHLIEYDRASQTRGVPISAPIVRELDDLDSILVSTRVAARVAAMLGFFITKNTDPEGYAASLAAGETDDDYEPVEAIQPGNVNYLNTGEKAESVGSKHPSAHFGEFVRLLCRIIGAAVGVPLELILLDFSEGNFSASRLALAQAHDTWAEAQEAAVAIVDDVFSRVMDRAVRAGRFPGLKPGAPETIEFFKRQWIPPGWPYIEPVKDVVADERAFKLRRTSRQRICARTGEDFFDIVDEIAEEDEYMRSKGVGEIEPGPTKNAGKAPPTEESPKAPQNPPAQEED